MQAPNFTRQFSNNICELLHQLTRTNKELEMVSDEIDDQTLRTAVDGLSHESIQFAEELSAELHTLGIPCTDLSLSKDEIKSIQAPEVAAEDAELPTLCTKNEHLLQQAYQQLLADPFPFPSLKDLLVFQFGSILNHFAKLRSLTQLKTSL